MATTEELEIYQNVRFFGELMGTAGITEENNKRCNDNIGRLLDSLDPFIADAIKNAGDLIEQRKQLASSILAPTSYDMNNLNIK